MSVRHLYLTRARRAGRRWQADGAAVSSRPCLLGRRLSNVPFGSVQHGPLPRATETAQLVARQLGSQVRVIELDAAGDYIPHVPSPDEVDPERVVYLADSLVKVLAEHVATHSITGKDRWLFAGEGDDPPHQNTVGYW